ncbi:hypothetical protein IMG5_058920 [Ichthyophthirius multifiliis]|uniref:Uncharacterized protein n=1 Tax=Ichthyophthirius multifiliis TaxID=5932 RepID=G0QNI2_ICHMU|nr:hypothetical protein IMG5_058920 [Ichthyophthirius multifiliis]EGR33216.1 hypothetical protein IMG5_058920 [Ichthyophthirius multifiliis]|eukprot:XP_004037202.1 hypothetical protein IMG5_058920 [Ichthyophthirius multifiliis]
MRIIYDQNFFKEIIIFLNKLSNISKVYLSPVNQKFVNYQLYKCDCLLEVKKYQFQCKSEYGEEVIFFEKLLIQPNLINYLSENYRFIFYQDFIVILKGKNIQILYVFICCEYIFTKMVKNKKNWRRILEYK